MYRRDERDDDDDNNIIIILIDVAIPEERNVVQKEAEKELK
jgi:hypothetical protein